MLQWMGGSRRKVTTSRKSTQKRQRQYFEHRKRQQQQPQMGALESHNDKKAACNLHQDKNRSLDILSLLTLTSNGQECNPCVTNARGNSKGEFMTSHYQNVQRPRTIQMETDKVQPAEPIDFREARTLPDQRKETVCAKECVEAFNGNSDEMDNLKMATDCGFSLVDLLGDEGQTSNCCHSLAQEAHVAFSTEGLGKVEMESPVHSPQQPARTFSYGCFSPFKIPKRADSSKNHNRRLADFEREGGDIICEVHMPYDVNSSELPLYPVDMMESFGNPKQNTTSSKEVLAHNDDASNLKDFFSSEEFFFSNEDQVEYKQNENSSFLHGNFFDESCGLPWEDWPCDFNSRNVDYLRVGNYEEPDISFEGLHVQKRSSSAKAACKFQISESSSPYIKDQKPHHCDDYVHPDRPWHPRADRYHEFKDVTNQSTGSPFLTEENLSFLSEESCSSSAVWREATKNPPHDIMGRRHVREHDTNGTSPVDKFGTKKNMFAQEQCGFRDCLQQRESIFCPGESIFGPGMCTRMSEASSSRSGHFSSNLNEISGEEGGWFFREGRTTRNVKQDINSFCGTSRTQKCMPSGCKIWTGDPVVSYSLPKSHADIKLHPETSNYVFSADCSRPQGSFLSEEKVYGKQSPFQSYENPICPNISSGSNKLNLFAENNTECKPDESSSGLCLKERDWPNTPLSESVSANRELESVTLPANGGKLEMQEEVCGRSNGIVSENGKPVAILDDPVLDCEDKCSNCEDPKGGTPDLEAPNAQFSPECSGEVSTSMEIPCIKEDVYERKECQVSAQASLPLQNGYEETQDSIPIERTRGSEGQTSDKGPCQVMRLESCVLQLLCIQVLKEASIQGTIKKVVHLNGTGVEMVVGVDDDESSSPVMLKKRWSSGKRY